jgi:aquaporin Z
VINKIWQKKPFFMHLGASHCETGSSMFFYKNSQLMGNDRMLDNLQMRKYAAEAIGTFWLTFAGCGSAVIAAKFPGVGIGLVGVSFAFGLSVLTMAYAIGHISGCHLNPAVTIGLAAGGRFPTDSIVPYIVAQVFGAIIAAAVLYVIASGAPGFDLSQGFAANGFGDHSPGKYSALSGFLTEVILTMMFLFIIMGATHGRAPAGFAPIAIGLGLTLINLVGIPVTNLSVNPARSTGPALVAGGWALAQLWMFWVAPILGGILGGFLYRWSVDEPAPDIAGRVEASAVSKMRRRR